MKKIYILFLSCIISLNLLGQNSEEAKLLLDEVSEKMGAYENMYIQFSQTLINEDAGIKKGDEPPIVGNITLQKEKYKLNYLGNIFIFDGKKMVVINNDDKEVTISEGDIDGDDGFIYPSKLLTFHKEGYNYEMGKLKTVKGRKIQFITLYPMDSESNIVEVKLAIDLNTKHIYQLIQTGENSSQTTFTITTFRSNQQLSETLFSLDTEKYSEKNGYSID
ncbi:outer membrane lipoprotein carrier protein LolA [Polaribacter sp. HL-MS24]|uniref:LolA family protein n=1 Tax=Polaribacter sp. HL-MS24 TaxID=3077735 RepID=UPI002934DCFB|nr:outer membrane lipoprotein carrier protein LolA [Polaribacter sp. HL-MS24]WOC40395.1 outer membrane lipoprotein carrier protein LolA [Polaribacter sp. HL-MS24]